MCLWGLQPEVNLRFTPQEPPTLYLEMGSVTDLELTGYIRPAG